MKILVFTLVLFCTTSVCAQTPADSVMLPDQVAGFPIIFYTPETRWAIGAGGLYVYRTDGSNGRASAVTASAIYTQNSQFIFEVTSNSLFSGETLWHQGNYFYQNYPNTFYGIGNATPDSGKESYTAEILRVNPALMTRLADKFYGGFLVHFETWSLKKTESGGILASGGIAGSGTTTVTGIGLLFNYDERDNLFSPRKGRYYQAGFFTSPEFLGSTHAFSRMRVDLREYSLFGDAHVIATQLLFASTSGTVPFRFLPMLGGQNVMRGYFEGRYRDRHLAVIQAEYRSPFVFGVGMALFASAGNVYPTLRSISTGTLKYAYGGGLRIAFIPEEHIILRIDFGSGENSGGMYITFTEAI